MPSPLTTLNLMVTADDFGVNQARDKGILELLLQGALTHVSLLVNGSTTRAAARTFRDAFPQSSTTQQRHPNTWYSENSGVPSFRIVSFNAVVDSEGGGDHDNHSNDDPSGKPLSVAGIAPRCVHPSIGLHFNITEGPPLSAEMRKCNVLVYFDEELKSYRFRGKAHNLVALDRVEWRECATTSKEATTTAANAVIANSDDDVINAVHCELNAQIAAFFALTSDDNHTATPSHGTEMTQLRRCWVDGHHHVHVTGVVHALLQAHPHISGTRSPRDYSLIAQGKTSEELGATLFKKESDCFGPPFWAHLASKSIHNNNNNADEKELKKKKHTTDYFLGLDMMGNACTIEGLHTRLCNILKASHISFPQSTTTTTTSIITVEVMTHVGYPVDDHVICQDKDTAVALDPFYHDEFSRSDERRHEYMVYSSTVPV